MLTPIVTYAYFAHDISDRERLMNRNNTGLILRDRNGKVFYEFGHVSVNDDVPLTAISDQMEHALVASEDKDFYQHDGFSPKGIAAAAYADVMNKDATRYGGSTLTQQLVKNKLLSSNKNFLRKYQEVAMAVAVERKYTKEEILDMYLNSVYFGEGAFGISDAAKVYFDKKPQDLTLAESSMLVGLLPAPSAYSPISGNPNLAKASQAKVLHRMAENGYISDAKAEATVATKLSYADASTSTNEYGQHFATMVIRQLQAKYGEERVTRSGFDVTTTLDLGKQKQAERIIKQRVEVMKANGGRNASLVAINPRNGEVQALVGSVDWDNKQFGQVNMATELRQPGSSFKPIYYSKALDDHAITAATVLNDHPVTFGGTYRPENFDHVFKGQMAVRDALAQSRNIPAIEVMQKVGVSAAATDAQNLGLTSVNQPDKYGLTLAVGTAEVRLIDLTNAYATFADQGVQHQRTMVLNVKDKFDHTVFKAKDKKHSWRSPEASFVLSSILSDNAARAPLYGSALNLPGRPGAVKTGTTNDNVDAWTVGYTPQLVTGVWVGNNEHEPMIGLAGGTAAGVIWRMAMTEFLRGQPVEQFSKPDDVVRVSVCKGTERRAQGGGGNTFSEYFIKGTEPTVSCVATVAPPKPKNEDKKPPKEEKPKPVKDDNKGPGNADDEEPEPPEPGDDGDPDDDGPGRGPGGGPGRGGGDEEPPTTPERPD